MTRSKDWLVILWFAGTMITAAASWADAGLLLDFAASRRAFVRMEADASTDIVLHNTLSDVVDDVRVRVELAETSQTFALGQLVPGAQAAVRLDVDARLRPDDYPMVVHVSGQVAGQPVTLDAARTIVITARPLERMPVLMWGGGDAETLDDIKFTHKLIWLQDYERVWEAASPSQAVAADKLAEPGEMLDDLLARGLGGAVYLYPGRWVGRTEGVRETFDRVDRQGVPRGRGNICATFPEVQAYAYNVGASIAQTFGHYPALQASLVHSEIRDATDLCFHDRDRAAYREFAGVDIPELATGKGGVRRASLSAFPADRVVPDDDALLQFYRWFWKEGDGWNRLHTQVHEGLKSTGRNDLWTFFDPAVRVPSLWGSGGDVDVVSQWTYSYPDPGHHVSRLGFTRTQRHGLVPVYPSGNATGADAVVARRRAAAGADAVARTAGSPHEDRRAGELCVADFCQPGDTGLECILGGGCASGAAVRPIAAPDPVRRDGDS